MVKAGILDTDGQVKHPVTGSPQGGITCITRWSGETSVLKTVRSTAAPNNGVQHNTTAFRFLRAGSTEANTLEEPGAGNPHAGICVGGVR